MTVSDRKTEQFVYKVRPGSETSVVFGTIQGAELTATVSDREITIGTSRIGNCVFNGVGAGVVVNKDGSMAIGAPIPSKLLEWFKKT